MTVIKKNPTNLPADGTSGRAYDATLFEVAAIKRLAARRDKSYGIGAIVMTHGESDAGNTNYANELYQLLTDYNADLAAMTGQTAKIPMLVSQQNSVPADERIGLDIRAAGAEGGRRSPRRDRLHRPEVPVLVRDRHRARSPVRAGVRTPGREDRAGLLRAGGAGARLAAAAAASSAERTGSDGHRAFSRAGAAAGPGTTSCRRRTDLMIPQWEMGRGFEVLVAGTRQTITGVEIVGDDTVEITCAGDLIAGEVVVGYAATAEGGTPPTAQPARWGHLRDSDKFMGTVTGTAQPNYCVAFQMTL